jgi:hypothetical protein
MARATPAPGVPGVPPVYFPGTPENQQVAKSIADAIQGAIDQAGNLPIFGQTLRPDYGDECDEQLERDITNCKIVGAVRGPQAYKKCERVAYTRYSQCLQYGPSGVRTPPYWSNTK